MGYAGAHRAIAAEGTNNPPIVNSFRGNCGACDSSRGSILTKCDIVRLWEKYVVPNYVVLHSPGHEEGVLVDDKRNEVCLYEKMFKVGLQLPFSRVVRELILLFTWSNLK